MPTNLFKSRWFNKAINAIYVQEKQPLASCILHIDRGNFGSAKSGVRRNHLSTSQKSPPHNSPQAAFKPVQTQITFASTLNRSAQKRPISGITAAP